MEDLMKKRKLLNAVFSVVLLIFLLAGCTTGKPTDNSESSGANAVDNSGVSSSESTTASAQVKDEASELTQLRSQIKKNNATVGVANLGFLANTNNISANTVVSDCITNVLLDKYPFLSKCKISLNKGNIMFAIVPASRSATVTVYKSGIDNNGNTKDDRNNVLFKSESGDPIVLLCNDNESFSNVLISVRDDNKTVEFHPIISLENGHDLVLTDGCYDFSVYDIRSYIDEAGNYLTTNVKEISDGIKSGMKLSYSTEVFMYNHYTLKFQLGNYNEEGYFIPKREYLIDEYYTLVFNTPDGNGSTGWEVVCGGLDPNGIKAGGSANSILNSVDEASNYLKTNVKDIRDGTKKGMKLKYDTEEFMYNHYALYFQLGTNTEDGYFSPENAYLIDDYYTLTFNISNDKTSTGWQVVCGGLDSNNVKAVG